MNDTLKLATWNLARPESARRRAALHEQVDAIGADVWVFTECHKNFFFDTHVHSSAEHFVRREYPTEEFFLLGDFNQDLVDPRYYGSATNRAALESALARTGLTALTSGANDPVRKGAAASATIDHICARQDSRWTAIDTSHWPETTKPDRLLSDHFGVSVQLSARAEAT